MRTGFCDLTPITLRTATIMAAVFRMTAATLAVVLVTGCQRELRKSVAAIDAAYSSGDYQAAAKLSEAALKQNNNDQQDRLLWWLEAGRTQQAAGVIDVSSRWYDRAFAEVSPYLDSKAEATISEALATTAVNQTIRIYKATPPERIMLCALQGANFLVQCDLARARIEFNRAADFQQDAAARFEREINNAQEAANKEWSKKGWNTQLATSATASVRKEQGRNPSTLGFASFANPFVSYLRSVFLIATSSDMGDRQNARADLRSIQEMMPGIAAAAEDIALIDAGVSHGSAAFTWVFFLTGLAPDYKEFRLDIPIPVGNVNYVSAAFPILRKRPSFTPTIAVAGAGGARSETIANIDAMVEADFDSRLPLIVTQEIISSAAKAAATWAASQAAYNSSSNSTAGILVQIAGIAYQAASTAADLRCWSTMPKQIALLRVPTPASGRLDLLREDGAALCTLHVEPGAPNIALVTLPSMSAKSPSIMLYRGGTLCGPREPVLEPDAESTMGPPAPAFAEASPTFATTPVPIAALIDQ